jgi:hypothetical protein
VYTDRLSARQISHQLLSALDARLAYARLASIAAIALVAVLAFGFGLVSPWWALFPLFGFLVLAIWHDRIIRAKNAMARAVLFYQQRIARIEDRWAGTGNPGARFSDGEHVYANDLDLFGQGSLFELLSLARTHVGEETLAAWLKGPAPLADLRVRQQAVGELRGRLDFREAMATAGAEAGEIDTVALGAWANRALPAIGVFPQVAGVVAAVAIGITAWWWAVGGPMTPLVAVLLVKVCLSRAFQHRVSRVLEGVEEPIRQLDILSDALTDIEQLQVESPRLKDLRAALVVDGVLPSQAVRQLQRLANMLEWPRNAFFAPIGAALSWTTYIAAAIERWRRQFGPRVPAWLNILGEYEALNSLAAYHYEHPGDPFPTFLDEGPATFDGVQLGHPLIPAAHMILNDVQLASDVRLLIISGSNMSGKSTLLRTVGINIVMAMAGAPVRAARLTLTPLAVGATLHIQDSLQAGRSRFFTEISRVRKISELAGSVRGPASDGFSFAPGDASARAPAAGEDKPELLFLLDELFQGTNSHDRRVGAAAVLRNLVGLGAIGLITTHDLALTTIAAELDGRAVNVHFEDTLRDGEMIFDYKMRPGPVTHSNALALMRAVGLSVNAE